MKINIKGIALFVLLAGTINLFTACSDDEEEEPLDKTPTINFIGGGDYTSSDVTVPAGLEVEGECMDGFGLAGPMCLFAKTSF